MKNINKIFNIVKIDNELIYLDKNKIIKILKIEPINFSLKSNEDKEIIINEYNKFLKNNDSNFQLLIKTRINDISKYADNIEKQGECNSLTKNYLKFVLSFLDNKNSEIKEFYIILSEIYSAQDIYLKTNMLKKNSSNIFENLNKCGNQITDITALNKKDILKIISYLINERENYTYENVF